MKMASSVPSEAPGGVLEYVLIYKKVRVERQECVKYGMYTESIRNEMLRVLACDNCI